MSLYQEQTEEIERLFKSHRYRQFLRQVVQLPDHEVSQKITMYVQQLAVSKDPIVRRIACNL